MINQLVDTAWLNAEERLRTRDSNGIPELRGMRVIFKEELLKLLFQPKEVGLYRLTLDGEIDATTKGLFLKKRDCL